MEKYLHVFGNGGRIGVLIGIGRDFWERSKEITEAMIKFF